MAPAVLAKRWPRRRLHRRRRAPPRAIVCAVLSGVALVVWWRGLRSPRPSDAPSPDAQLLNVRIPDARRPDAPTPAARVNVSAVVLFHNEYDTLRNTVASWERGGLLDAVDEVVFFLNGVADIEGFRREMPMLAAPDWAQKATVVNSKDNLRLGLAIARVVELAAYPHVLLLEKDWALVEPADVVRAELRDAGRLVTDGVAHVVRFRHRHRPGAPLHARIMHEKREAAMLRQQSNLFCNLHHWVKDPVANYSSYFSRCEGDTNDEEPTWCSPAKYCQWNNNPGLFSRTWFLDGIGAEFKAMYEATFATDPGSNMLDFEYFTNWRYDVWNNKPYVVALPLGLFEHQEVGEQNLMNTVWYAWNRLTTDVTEKQREYLSTELEDCAHNPAMHASGASFPERFPLDFVHMYHYNQSMERTVEEAVAEIDSVSKSARALLERGEGSWRHGVTELTNNWHKVSLFTFPTEPSDITMTFVTAMYEGNVDLFASNLEALSEYPRIIYATAGMIDQVKSKLSLQALESARFVPMSEEQVGTYLLTEENVARVRDIRQREDWITRAKARRGGKIPSETESIISLSKPHILHDAASRESALKTSHYLWIDGETDCLGAFGSVGTESQGKRMFCRSNDHILRSNMLLNIFVTQVSMLPGEDLYVLKSGFDVDALMQELEITGQARNGASIADGRVFGGSRAAVALLTGYYDVVARDMLRKGHLGSEREPISIAMKNVGYAFAPFDGWTGCRQNSGGDHACPRQASQSSPEGMFGAPLAGCRLFGWSASCDKLRLQ